MNIYPSKLLNVFGFISLLLLSSLSTNVFAAKPVITGPEQAYTGSSVAFDGITSSINPQATTTYEWDFGDGKPVETTLTPQPHTFDNSGTYNVKLTITDPTAHSEVKIITVIDSGAGTNIAPTAKMMINDAGGNEATTFLSCTDYTFVSQSIFANTTMNNNNWDFGDLANKQQNNEMPIQLSVEFGTSANPLSSLTHQFRAVGTYTITLASQSNFPDPGLKALTGTTQKTITVTQGPACAIVTRAIEDIYDTHCANCHGIVVRDPITKAFNPNGYTNLGEFSFLAGFGAVARVFTPAEILAAYDVETRVDGETLRLMKDVYKLSDIQITEMITYIQTLKINPVARSGKQLYLAQCSRCHGRGDGAYARGVLKPGNTEMTLKEYIDGNSIVPVMSTIPYTLDGQNGVAKGTLTLIAEFLNADVRTKLPLSGDGLNIMYCSFCHGVDGTGGPFVYESIAGAGITGKLIQSEILIEDSDNMMSRLGPSGTMIENLGEDISSLDKIAESLNNRDGPPPAGENEEDDE